jgi:uncharacterized DUF497 family protein
MIHLSWDETKNRKNRRKHGISFELAQKIFGDPQAQMYRNQLVEREQRFATIGWVQNTLLTVIHTYDEDNHEFARIISARKAMALERKLYARHKSQAVD